MVKLNLIIVIIVAIAIVVSLASVYKEDKVNNEVNLPEECSAIKDAVISLSFEDAVITEKAAQRLAELYCEQQDLKQEFPSDIPGYELRLISWACESSDTKYDELRAYNGVYCSSISDVIILRAQALLEELYGKEDINNINAATAIAESEVLINEAMEEAESKPYTAYIKLDKAEAIIVNLSQG